jgi:XTP/dITP diphosphohydrolase
MLLVVASRNRDKIAELRHALAGLPLEIRGAGDFAAVPEVEETGATLEENARLKARAAWAATGHLALADDTGLEVDALGGAPGVHSARFAGPGQDYARNLERLLERMSRVPVDRRGARFRTVLVIVLPEGAERIVEGVCSGRILEARRGAGGFGYDPVFLVPELGRTFAEMTLAEKDRVSHRGRAVRAAREILEAYLAGAIG